MTPGDAGRKVVRKLIEDNPAVKELILRFDLRLDLKWIEYAIEARRKRQRGQKR